MTTLSIRITSDTVQVGIRKVSAGLPEATDEELAEFMQDVKREASGGYSGGNSYTVPERGDYERTGNYGRGFYVEKEGLTYRLHNSAYRDGREYNVYVGGSADGGGQAWMHVGRWPLVRDVVDKLVNSKLVKQVDDRLQRLIREAGVGL